MAESVAVALELKTTNYVINNRNARKKNNNKIPIRFSPKLIHHHRSSKYIILVRAHIYSVDTDCSRRNKFIPTRAYNIIYYYNVYYIISSRINKWSCDTHLGKNAVNRKFIVFYYKGK